MTDKEIIDAALSFPIKKRMKITLALLRSLSADKLLALGCETRCKQLMSVMACLMGVDEIPNSREEKWVWARIIIANQLRYEGYSYAKIGKAIGKDHATVIHYCERLKTAQSLPNFYRDELKLFELFSEALVKMDVETVEK